MKVRPKRDVGRRSNGWDAYNKDDFKRTHLVRPLSPVYPSTALLLKIFRQVLIETRAVRVGPKRDFGRTMNGRHAVKQDNNTHLVGSARAPVAATPL